MDILDSAKTIVCYGDSNTWGQIPNAGRYPRSVRWTGVLQQQLGNKFEVVNEGLPGRTLVAINSAKPWKNGIAYLKAILLTHEPVEVIVIMLGTNDVKLKYNLTPERIAKHLEETISLLQKEETIPKILVICPPEIIHPDGEDLKPEFTNGPEISKKLPSLYKAVVEKYGCNFLNAQDYIASSKVDGFHFDPEMHAKLAVAIKDELIKMSI